MSPLVSLLLLCYASAIAAALSWQRHSLPLSGELVLTDVHSVLSGSSVQTYATGEAGVLLKQVNPISAAANATPWTISLDTSFPFYWYGVYTWPDAPNETLISGFYDGDSKAYGIIQFTEDGGATWSNDTVIDAHAWGGGPIEFAGNDGIMPSTSGSAMWRTSTGGKRASDWTEVVPDSQNWHAGDFVFDGDGYVAIAGSSFCNSTDFGGSWECSSSEDASGMDGGIACSGAAPGEGLCLTGGGEIEPAVLGWVHVSHDGGNTWGPRSLNSAFPIRSVLAVNASSGLTLFAAGGNFFSGVGGVYASFDAGKTWDLSLDLGEEVKACRPVKVMDALTRVFCVSAGPNQGSVVSVDL